MNTDLKTKPHKGATPKRSGAEAAIEALKAEGVELLFGVTGGAIMPMYDALFRDGTLRHIIVGHEQGGAHMAEGYARVTGEPGVILTTSGPGATNLVTGLADAIMDSTPLVAITGQVATSLIGNDAFQEADVRGITMPVTKHNYLIQRADELPRIFAEGFHIARTGRPGPVLIDLPKDISNTQTAAPRPERVQLEGYDPPYQGHPHQIQRALQALQQAHKPVILAGGGVLHAEACGELREFAEALNLPSILNATKTEIKENFLTATVHQSAFLNVESQLPAVVSIDAEAFAGTYANAWRLVDAYRKMEIEVWNANELGLSAEDLKALTLKKEDAFPPERQLGTQVRNAKELVAILKREKIVA